jgi:cysteine synthase A|tara:strand:+ start:3957 stop:4850 length:894 start_codon:yes stop_codon:yes gene_type:complete
MKLSYSVGNTPLIPIRLGDYTVWGKAEFMNPSGSVKDRMATYILNHAEDNKLIEKGDTLIEATSGNTGIAFAMLAAERGYNIKIVMPSNMSEERKQMLRFYGADLIEVGAGDFDGAIEMRDTLAESSGWFNCNQFHNPLNIEAHYKNTGPEINRQFRALNSDENIWPQALVAGTGTGGTIMGAGKYLQEQFPGLCLIAVEPAESAVMSGGDPGLHGIQGIGDGSKFMVDLNKIKDIRTVHTECAKKVAKHLALRYGLFVGISAGANVMASFQWMRDNDKKNVITILCDRGERYFSCL